MKKIPLLLCWLWGAYVLFAYTKAYYDAKPFVWYLEQDCPQLVIDVLPKKLNLLTISRNHYVELLAWFDKKTGEEIFVDDYDHPVSMGGIGFSCDYLEQMAKYRLQRLTAGEIEPVLRVKWGYFFLILCLPIGLLMCVRSYLNEREFLKKNEKLKDN